MHKSYSFVSRVALIHDIGKILQRTGEYQSKEQAAVDFIKKYSSNSEEQQELIFISGSSSQNNVAYVPSETSPVWLIREAGKIAEGINRLSPDTKPDDNYKVRLSNIFNSFDPDGAKQSKSYFSISKFISSTETNCYPAEKDKLSSSAQAEYRAIVSSLEKALAGKNLLTMETAQLEQILEDHLSHIPAETENSYECHISLYEHLKTTAALASCMQQYYEAQGINNFKEQCAESLLEQERSKEIFLLLSAEFSGIQKFIYRIQSKGAMRMLRGRSFFLEILLENTLDEILDRLGLTRCNLIYSGGGHFYLLVANTEDNKKLIRDAFGSLNSALLNSFGTVLFLASGYTEITADELIGKTSLAHNYFARAAFSMSDSKRSRYDIDTARAMFDEQNELNKPADGSRECALCHRSNVKLQKYFAAVKADAETVPEVCPTCNGLYMLGKLIIDDKTVFVILNENGAGVAGALPLPSPFEKRFLATLPVKNPITVFDKKLPSFREAASADAVVRIYNRNDQKSSSDFSIRIWTGDYAAKENNTVLDFSDLARYAGDKASEKGINRLGVLRADVDWLGASFMAGFNSKKSGRSGSITDYASLSHSLGYFFKNLINKVAEKQLPPGQKPFYIFQSKEGQPRNIHIVYSGGDDLFIVGAWDDLLETAIDLRESFRLFTNDKLSFSAGLGLFSSSYPISRMASDTAELEDAGKSRKVNGQQLKDGIALWGSDTYFSKDTAQKVSEKYIPMFSWNDLKDKVIREKLGFLVSHLNLSGINDLDPARYVKLDAGKSLLYRLRYLLQTAKGTRFNLARFAYCIARIEPKKTAQNEVKQCYQEIRSQLYAWAGSEQDRLQLSEALTLIIYRMRDKE